MFISTATAVYSLGHGLRTLEPMVPRLTQPFTLLRMVKWQVAMVDVDGSSHLSADSQPNAVGLVQGLVATGAQSCHRTRTLRKTKTAEKTM